MNLERFLARDYIATTISIVVIAVSGFTFINLHQNNKQNLAKIEELELNLKLSSESIYNLQTENASLTEKVKIAEENIVSLENKNKKLDDKNDELKKIVSTDPELLKKYSKVYFLNENYEPEELSKFDSEFVYPNTKEIEFLDQAKGFIDDLMEDAKDDDINILISSGYRSFKEQTSLKGGYRVTYGAGTANSFSAEQGYSEHQLGTAVDFVTSENSYYLTTNFENTKAFKWLQENAYKYGFILSYPKGNTYYQYEPWHWRFVGKDLARKLHRNEMNFYDMEQRDIDRYIGELFD